MENNEYEDLVFERTATAFGEMDRWKDVVLKDIDDYWQGLIPLHLAKEDFDFMESLFELVKTYRDVDHDFLSNMRKEFRNEVMKAIYQRGINYETFMNAKEEKE